MTTHSPRLITEGEKQITPDLPGAGSFSGRLGGGMADFSEWDFAESFTAVQAALLIEGKKPSDCGHNGKDGFGNIIVSEVILNRMQDAYDDTHMGYALSSPEFWPPTLPSNMMNILINNLSLRDGKESFKKWLLNNEEANFHKQSFTRKDIQYWLDVNHLPSIYRFDQSPTKASDRPSLRWPWGNHHTDMLGHVEAAANRFWVNYDPTDATTAPTNKDVSEWLITERKVSQKMAESIASILRPDGLATGPRK